MTVSGSTCLNSIASWASLLCIYSARKVLIQWNTLTMSVFKRPKLHGQETVTRVSVDPTCKGGFEIAANSEKGIMSFPLELQGEVLSHFQKIDYLTRTPHDNPILPEEYMEYTDALRALSQVSVAYRHVFLPLLWETVNVCFSARGANSNSFFKHVGEALIRKSDGLKANPELRPLVKRLNVVLTRYQSKVVLSKFGRLLKSLPNLTTLHLLHSHTQMTSAFQETFEGVVLPGIRTLLIQGHCHHLLSSCPNVKDLWCIRGDGHKLVSMIEKHCKSLEELHGFHLNEKYMKKLVKAAPDLRAFDIPFENYQTVLAQVPHFKQLDTMVIRAADIPKFNSKSYKALQKCIQDVKSKFATMPNAKEKGKIRILYEDVGSWKLADTFHLPFAQYGNIDIYEAGV
ncbi:hypothetical protein CPB84DRAFT_1764716 [Gymnopilus junonius]|uniref:Uncharacterized protein n=1 Tax=Gymnopilus junonius TaxID=109634 RepID=A0A9P5TSW1_GYMJU|nr:hypothetical protein CPB84DRAFT_1764716 [Gymnopilus junonius]